MKFFFLFLILSTQFAHSNECKVELFSKIYRTTKGQALQSRDVIINSSCDEALQNKIGSILTNTEGTLGIDFLKNELKKEFPSFEITFSPNKISLLELSDVLKDQLLANTNLFFMQTRSLNGLATLGLSEGEQMRAVCDSCQSFGEKNVKIDIINPIKNTNRALWFNSKIMAKVKVVKANRSISFQQKNLNQNDFYFDDVYTMTPDNSLSSLENIHFYKSNKTIMQNAVVSNLDLQAVNLVTYGTPVQVSLLNQNISLQKSAMPTRSARFGETIEIKGPNNKTLAAKVVDYNKVVIEL